MFDKMNCIRLCNKRVACLIKWIAWDYVIKEFKVKCERGKYQSMYNTKIGINMGKSYQENEELSR